jgi:hypothetical protein
MGDPGSVRKRRTFRWPAKARELVNANLQATGSQLRQVVTQLVEITGNPRSACRRFIYRIGNIAKKGYKKWPVAEQERLLDLLDKYTVAEVAQRMRCSRSAVYGMLRRLKTSAGMRQDLISKNRLAALLHVHVRQIDSWIQSGMLEATVTKVGEVKRTVIKPEDFYRFCLEHRERILGNRLNLGRLEFVYKYVFPPDHNHLLSVREHKKERTTRASLPSTANADKRSENASQDSSDDPADERSIASS